MRMFLASICVSSIVSSNHLSVQCRPPNSWAKTARWRKCSSTCPSSFLLARSMIPLPLVPTDQEQPRREDVFPWCISKNDSPKTSNSAAPVTPPFFMPLPPKIPSSIDCSPSTHEHYLLPTLPVSTANLSCQILDISRMGPPFESEIQDLPLI